MIIKTKIHLPVNENGKKVKIVPTQPVVFLAGPIGNAPEWRNEAISLLIQNNADIFIASPKRTISDELKQYVEVDNTEYELFERQRAWEQYYLECASKNGCILFYLPKEMDKKEIPDKVYAHITMLELGEWITRYNQNNNINLVIATDGNFQEWSTIEYELKTIGITKIYFSLEEGIDAVLKLVQ